MKPKRPKRYKPDRLDASAITPELALEWRAPRFGTENPHRMNNPLWEWLVKTRINAYSAGDRFGYPSPFDAGPAWCFARFGQSVTPLPDGRLILIAGEHEDSYDPDFHIYNDVTVYHPDGKLDLFGYPETVIPPTDFHTATLLDDRIIVIGNLGYPDNRKAGITQIAELDLKTFAIRLIRSTGTPPGWIHKHIAELAPDQKSIQVRGGLIDPADKDRFSLLENPDAWSLDLGTWEWTRLTHCPWERHVFYAEGVRWLPLRQIDSLSSSMKYNWGSKLDPEIPTPEQTVPAEKWEEFQDRFGTTNPTAQAEAAGLYAEGSNPDLDVFGQLYQPALPHTAIPEPESPDEEAEEEYDENGPYDWDEEDYSTPGDVFNGTRISVNGVVVRYKDNMDSVILTIEGKLPPETVQALIADLKGKLEILLNRPVITRQL
jgi:hypothetical protein